MESGLECSYMERFDAQRKAIIEEKETFQVRSSQSATLLPEHGGMQNKKKAGLRNVVEPKAVSEATDNDIFCEAFSHKLPKVVRPSRRTLARDGKEGAKPIDHRFRAERFPTSKWKI